MAKVLVLNRAAVFRLLSIADCIPLVDRALREVSSGGTIQPTRSRIVPPGIAGMMGMMPGYAAASAALGVKVVTVFEGNFANGLPSHRGAVLLFDGNDGALKGIFDAGAVTAIRTAAASAVATQALAVQDAQRLAILGYGEQAAAHVEAIAVVRPIRQLTVWGRSPSKAVTFASSVGKQHGIDARAEATVDAAVAGAQIVCATTAAHEPILHGSSVAAGCHVNLVGSSFPDAREADSELVLRGRLFADSRAMVEALGGEWRRAVETGVVPPSHLLGEIGEVLLGTLPGRRDPAEITVFKSVGLIAEDLAAVSYLYDSVSDRGHVDGTTWVDF